MAKYILAYWLRIAAEKAPETFGRLTTIGPLFLLPVGRKKRACSFVVCSCVCGEQVVSRVDDLRNGRILSCGCLKSETTRERATSHGMSDTDEHHIWLGMNQRCTNPTRKQYKDYGGRGIGVFSEWQSTYGQRGEGFTNFMQYMGPRPSKKHSIDRFPNPDGNYEPGNVRWATAKEQANNKTNNVLLTHRDKTQTLSQWAKEIGISAAVLSARVVAGWSSADALGIPCGVRRDSLRHNGVIRTYADWASDIGMQADTLMKRIQAGWDVDRALTTPVKKRKPSPQK